MRLLITWLMCFCLIVWVPTLKAAEPQASVAVAVAIVKARLNAQPELPNSIEQKPQPGAEPLGDAGPADSATSTEESQTTEPPQTAPPVPPLTLTLDPVAAQQITPEPGMLQWLVFIMPGCAPCVKDQRDFQPWLIASGWRADENLDSQIRLVDVYKYPELQKQFGVETVPEYILVHGDQVIERHNRYPGKQRLAERFIEVKNSLPPQSSAGAVTIGTISGGKVAAKATIDWMTEMVGESGTFEGTWTRGKGAATTISVADGVEISVPNPLGIRYDVVRANQTVRISFTKGRPALRMKVLGILPAQQSVSAINLDTSEIVLELPRMIDPRFKLD